MTDRATRTYKPIGYASRDSHNLTLSVFMLKLNFCLMIRENISVYWHPNGWIYNKAIIKQETQGP